MVIKTIVREKYEVILWFPFHGRALGINNGVSGSHICCFHFSGMNGGKENGMRTCINEVFTTECS